MKFTEINEIKVDNACGEFEVDLSKYARNMIIGYHNIRRYVAIYQMFALVKGM